MDLDVVGADLTDESQLTLNPSSGLDPSRQVKYVPTAATAIYPNVTQPLYASASVSDDVEPKTAAPLAGVPVIGQNVAAAPVDLTPPNPANLTPKAQVAQAAPIAGGPNGPAPLYPPVAEPPAQRYRPQAYPPGTNEGLFGTDRQVVPEYQKNINQLEAAKGNLQGRVDDMEKNARSPFNQLWFGTEATGKLSDEAAQKRLQIKQIDDAIQAQKDIVAKGANAGLRLGPNATENTIVNELTTKMLSGDPVKAEQASQMLTAFGHGDLVKGMESQTLSAMEGTIKYRQELQQRLDTAKSDQEYDKVSKEIKVEAERAGVDVPKSRGEWEAKRQQRINAGQQAMAHLARYKTMLAEQSDYTPTTNKEAAAINASKATYSTGEQMHNVKGVDHKGNATTGGQAQSGSHILRDYGRTWDTYDEPAREEFDKRVESAFPKTEREKAVNLQRAIKLATTDPKTGKPMTDEETMKLINTNPSVMQVLVEGITAAARGGAGGTNGQLIKLELAKRGPVQAGLDQLISAWAGGRGVITGKEGQYLSKFTQGQMRYVVDFLKDYNTKDISTRLGGAAERLGMYGGKLENSGLEPELQDALQNRRDIGRDKQIQHMGGQYRVIGEDNSTFVGTGKAAAAVPGAVRTPIPASALPALYPELQVAPPAATNVAPSGSSAPSGTTTKPTPPPDGADSFWKSRKGTEAEPLATKVGNVAQGALGITSAQAAETPPSPNYDKAMTDLKLTPQEKNLYEFHLHNLNGPGGVDNADGSRSTLYQANVEHNGKHYNIPTVYDGKILSQDAAAEKAKQIGWDKFPSYKTADEAEARYQKMHAYMEKDTGDYLASRQPKPQQPAGGPGGPGTATARPPASFASPPSMKSGGTFTQGTPSSGFPASINNNGTARTVYGVAGQAAQNAVGNKPNAATIATNTAIVTASSAQSESNFNPNAVHKEADGNDGYGLFGHRLSRLTAMHQFNGSQPGQPIPPNVQAAFFAREMSRAADADPFIAQTLANPNASAEDLTRVQIRMESPKGYKGPGTEEQANNWSGRLANTRALMAGGGNAAVPEHTTAPGVPAATVPTPVPSASALNPRNALAAVQQKAAQVGADKVFENAPNYAPAVGGVVGAAAGGPVGAVIGGGVGGGIKNYFGPAENQTLGGVAKDVGFGAAQGGVAAIPGIGPLATTARIGLSGAIPGFEKFVEGKDAGEIYDAAAQGLVGGALGEGFGRALGAAGNALWGGYSKATQAELISIGKTLTEQEPKIMDATGKMVENAVYTKALDRAKQLGQNPDNLSHAWTTAEKDVASGQRIPPTTGEALSQRPGQVEQLRVGREEYNPIKDEITNAPKPTAANAPAFKYDPTNIVGKPGGVPVQYKNAAEIARDTMNAPARNWREIWQNQVDARSALLNKSREAEAAAPYAGQKQDMEAYRKLADEVRKQQVHIAEKILGPKQAADVIQRLEKADDAYRRASVAGGDDLVQTVSNGGKKGREALAAFKQLADNDPAAERMLNALLSLHNKTQGYAKTSAWTGAGILVSHIPGVGPVAAGAIGAVKGLHMIHEFMMRRASGSTVKFSDMVRKEMSSRAVGRLSAGSNVIGAAAAPGVVNAVTGAPAQ